MKNQKIENLSEEIDAFKNTQKTIQLSTINEHQKPNVSYAPFVQVNNCFYILISQLAQHTQNLQKNPVASLMLIDDENTSANIFARRRLTFSSSASAVTRNSDTWVTVLNAFEERFGRFVRELESFKDFHLFELTVDEGLFVKGFGQAYQLSGQSLSDLSHRIDGHEEDAKKSA